MQRAQNINFFFLLFIFKIISDRMHKIAREIHWYNISEERGVLDFLIRFSLKFLILTPT